MVSVGPVGAWLTFCGFPHVDLSQRPRDFEPSRLITVRNIARHFYRSDPQLGDADAEIKVPICWKQSLRVLPLTPGVGQYIAIHATLTARDFFLANFYPPGLFTCIFFQNLSRVFPVLAVANTGSCVGQQNKTGHSTGCRFLYWVPAACKQALKHVLLFFWVCFPKLWVE